MIQLTLPPEKERLGSFIEFVERFARDLAFPPQKIQKLVLILEEALLNVINYAYSGQEAGQVNISCWEEQGALVIQIKDTGRPFNPLEIPDPDLSKDLKTRPIGGLGVFLIRKIADEVSYRRENETNVLTLVVCNKK